MFLLQILHCLTRLAKLKVSVNHLQITGIGKIVAGVRRLEGEVGDLARTLVAKWKDMVAEAEKAELMKTPLFSKLKKIHCLCLDHILISFYYQNCL